MSDEMNNYYNTEPPKEEGKGFAIAALVLGCCGLFAWCLPLLGYPVTIVGIIMGIIGIKKGAGKTMAIIGLILSILFLLLTLGNSILGVVMNLSALNEYM